MSQHANLFGHTTSSCMVPLVFQLACVCVSVSVCCCHCLSLSVIACLCWPQALQQWVLASFTQMEIQALHPLATQLCSNTGHVHTHRVRCMSGDAGGCNSIEPEHDLNITPCPPHRQTCCTTATISFMGSIVLKTECVCRSVIDFARHCLLVSVCVCP